MSEPPKQIGIAVVEQAGRYLVGIRPKGAVLAGYAEFPGGKFQPNETPQLCAVRECLEETGLTVEPVAEIECVRWSYPHGDVELHFVRCQVIGDTQPQQPFRWVAYEELACLRFPEANAAVVGKIVVQAQTRSC